MTHTCTSQADTATTLVFYVLATINLFAIGLGLFAFYLRLKHGTAAARKSAVTFYSLALSCLLVSEVGYFSDRW